MNVARVDDDDSALQKLTSAAAAEEGEHRRRYDLATSRHPAPRLPLNIAAKDRSRAGPKPSVSAGKIIAYRATTAS